MDEECTTAVVQRYLDELACDAPAEPVVRALLDQAVQRLHHLCATLLYRSYPRLTRPPLNLQADELLSAVASLGMSAHNTDAGRVDRMVALLVDGLRYGASAQEGRRRE